MDNKKKEKQKTSVKPSKEEKLRELKESKEAMRHLSELMGFDTP